MNNIATKVSKINIEKWGNGFRARIMIRGKRKAFYGKTRSEIKRKLKEHLLQQKDEPISKSNTTLGSYAVYWLTEYKKNKIEPTSFARLQSVYNNIIKDNLGNIRLCDLKLKHIQGLIDSYSFPLGDRKALSKSGLKKIKDFLNPCLNIAVEEGLIRFNPCKNIIIPIESCIATQTKKQFSLTDKELEVFKEGCLEKYKTTNEYKSRDSLVLLVMLNIGLRAGEMLVLRWDDINFADRTIKINKILQSNIKNDEANSNDKKRYNRIKNSSKTAAGERFIPLSNTVSYYLNELKEYDARNNIHSEYIACTRVGTINSPRNLRRSLDRIVNRKGLNSNISLHTLRHTFGSTLLRNGVGVEVISKLMGHSNITITYNKYIHVVKEEEAKAMNLISIC